MLVTTASAFIRVFFGYFIDVGTLSIRSTSSYFHPLRNRTDGTKLTACTARLLLSAAHSARSACRATTLTARKSIACTARLSLSAAHSACSARRKAEADLTKINLLHGKASRCPQHILLVPSDAQPKQTARNSTACTAKLLLTAAHIKLVMPDAQSKRTA